jgi:DNA-directed RNA polymerase subunit RPC12/RpoP
MSDIFFKCEACGNPLVVDDAGAGLTVDCPDCRKVIAIPKVLLVHECPHCKQKAKASAEMKGETVRCSGCQHEFSIPGQPPRQPAAARLIALICPNCQAEIETPEEVIHHNSPCPNCGESVHFRVKLRLKESTAALPLLPPPSGRKKLVALVVLVLFAVLILLAFLKFRSVLLPGQAPAGTNGPEGHT